MYIAEFYFEPKYANNHRRGGTLVRSVDYVLPESHGNRKGEQNWSDVNSNTQCECCWFGVHNIHCQTIDRPDYCKEIER